MVYYFNNSINVAHFDIALLLLHCCINNSSQFLEDKIQTWVFSISGFLIKSLTSSQVPHKKLCNSRHSYVIDVKLEPLLKLDKKGTLTSKKMAMTISSFFFQFQTDLEQSKRMVRDLSFFSLIIALYLRKAEKRIKKLLNTKHILLC